MEDLHYSKIQEASVYTGAYRLTASLSDIESCRRQQHTRLSTRRRGLDLALNTVIIVAPTQEMVSIFKEYLFEVALFYHV